MSGHDRKVVWNEEPDGIHVRDNAVRPTDIHSQGHNTSQRGHPFDDETDLPVFSMDINNFPSPRRVPSRARGDAQGHRHAGRPRPARGALVAVGVCAAVYILAGIAISKPGGFWSPDSAVRFVQVESLLSTGFRTMAIPYPAASLDPTGRFFPFGPWFHFTRAGQYYLSYPPYFAMLVAPMFRWFGPPGLLILPIVGGLASVFVTYWFLSSTTPELAMTGALTLGLATPLLAYSTTFWDHSLTVALSAGALALLARDPDLTSGTHLLLAGGLLGAGLWFRNEMYLLALACLAAWLYAAPLARWQGALRIAAGLTVPTIVLWGLNHRLTGSLLGWKAQDLVAGRTGRLVAVAAGHSAGSWIVDKLGNVYFQLISPDFYGTGPGVLLTGVVLAALVVLAGTLIHRGVVHGSPSLITIGGASGVIAGIVVISGRTIVSGLVASAPWVALAFLPGPRVPRDRLLWAVVGLFTAAVIVTGTHGGLQWGPRYLLPIFPPLVWLAAFGADRVRDAAPEDLAVPAPVGGRAPCRERADPTVRH